MIGGTSGSDTKLCQPSASQSKSTQTRSSWLGSRNTSAPLDPCSFRFSAPLVEKMLRNCSKSSTVVVARIMFVLLRALGAANRRRCWRRVSASASRRTSGERPMRRNEWLCSLFGVNEVVLEGPKSCGSAAADARLLVDVLDVVPRGLGGDAEPVADRLVRFPPHQGEQDLQLTRR